MTAIVEIDLNTLQGRNFLQYARTLPFTTVVEEKVIKTDFEQAVSECDGRPVTEFFDDLRKQVKDHFRGA